MLTCVIYIIIGYKIELSWSVSLSTGSHPCRALTHIGDKKRLIACWEGIEEF